MVFDESILVQRLFPKKLKAKHFFIIIFTGLNSSLVQDYLALCLLIPASFLIKQSINNLKTVIEV